MVDSTRVEELQMASEIQARVQLAKANIADNDDLDARSVMDDMIKDDVSETGSVRSVSTTSSRRFRILPNPKKMIQRAFGGGGRVSLGSGAGAYGGDPTDRRSVQSGGSVSSIFSKFKMKDLHKDQEIDYSEAVQNHNNVDTDIGGQGSSVQSSVMINDLNAHNSGHVMDRNVDREQVESLDLDVDEKNSLAEDEVENVEFINITRKDSNESIISTMSNWSNFGFHIFGSTEDSSHVAESHPHIHTTHTSTTDQLKHEKATSLSEHQPEADDDMDDKKSTFSNSSQKSKFSSSSFGKMKKKVVKFFLKNSNDTISAERTNSNNSVLSLDTVSQLEQYNKQQEENIKTLMGLGFDRQAATAALVASKNDVDAAANRLLAELEHPTNRASVKPTLSTVSEDSEYMRPRNGPPSW